MRRVGLSDADNAAGCDKDRSLSLELDLGLGLGLGLACSGCDAERLVRRGPAAVSCPLSQNLQAMYMHAIAHLQIFLSKKSGHMPQND